MHARELFCGCYLFAEASRRPRAESGGWAIYVGLTKRTLEVEYLCWLTPRGSGRGDGNRNRPVLVRADGTGITKKVAEKELKAIGFFVMHSKLRFNCSEVEDRLQGLCHHYGLGRRLHRVVGAGGGGPVDPEEATNKDYLAKVFLTCLRVTEWQPPLGPGVAITGMRVGGEMLQVVQ